jgi:hypothetical protein
MGPMSQSKGLSFSIADSVITRDFVSFQSKSLRSVPVCRSSLFISVPVYGR